MNSAKHRRLQKEKSLPPAWNLWIRKDYGGALAAWLNSSFPSEAQARSDISEAIHDMNNLDVDYTLVRGVYDRWRAQPNQENENDFLEEQTHVRPLGLLRLLRKVSPRMGLARDATPFDKWELKWAYRVDDDAPAPSFHEAAQIFVSGMDQRRAIACLIKLAEGGLVGRVRRCDHCHKWLYAKLERQRFCSGPCREKAFRGSIEGKKKRMEYMQGYRARLKCRDLNNLKASERGRR